MPMPPHPQCPLNNRTLLLLANCVRWYFHPVAICRLIWEPAMSVIEIQGFSIMLHWIPRRFQKWKPDVRKARAREKLCQFFMSVNLQRMSLCLFSQSLLCFSKPHTPFYIGGFSLFLSSNCWPYGCTTTPCSEPRFFNVKMFTTLWHISNVAT